jgi:AraC family transcriptional regulator
MSDQLIAIQTAIEFIEKHLRDEITVADIAAAAGYSLYHFIRKFNQIVHHTPYDYLMSRRLSEAARELVDSRTHILEIALAYGFNNHETFSRAFKRMFGLQPSQMRAGGKLPYRSPFPKPTLPYLEHINRGVISRPELIKREATQLLGLMTRSKNDLPEQWNDLERLLRDSFKPNSDQALFQPLSFWRVNLHPASEGGSSYYFTGVKTAGHQSYPHSLAIQSIPPGEFAQFTHQGTSDTLPFTLDYIYRTWFKKSGHDHSYGFELICFGDTFPSDQNKDQNLKIFLPLKCG